MIPPREDDDTRDIGPPGRIRKPSPSREFAAANRKVLEDAAEDNTGVFNYTVRQQMLAMSERLREIACTESERVFALKIRTLEEQNAVLTEEVRRLRDERAKTGR